MIDIGIIGLWVVWSSVAKNILKYHKNKINIKSIYTLYPTASVSAYIYETNKHLFVNDLEEVLNDQQIDLIVETVWWTTIAKDIVQKAIENRKNVVTANKNLIAIYGQQLIEKAKQYNVSIKFGASVGWWIPIINVLESWIVADKIVSIRWILNWTCNYILTNMMENNIDFKTALYKAKQLWYAESDPTNDIEWIDTAYKIIILSQIAFWVNLSLKNLQIKGISHINITHIQQAKKLWKKIKLIWVIENKNWKITAYIRPEFINKSDNLYHVDWVLNGIEVIGENQTTFYSWPGAGGDATSIAVISDIMKILD